MVMVMTRYRLEPTADQQVSMVEHCRHARYVWNLAVEQQRHWRPGRGPAPSYNAQSRQLTEARSVHAWLRAGSHTVQQQALRDFNQAMSNFFNGTHRRPAWRKAGVHEGFRQIAVKPHHIVRLNRRHGRVWIPKVGWVRIRWSRAIPDGVRSYREARDRAGRCHIALAVIPEPTDPPANGTTVGVDRGVSVSAPTSHGDMLSCPGLSTGEQQRLLRLQRKLVHAKPGSNRRKRVKTDIAKLRARDADRRKDWVEKTSTGLARNYDTIRVEDLDVRGMTRSAKGTVEQPGSRVKQQAGLNREILANGWGMLVSRLEHKAPGRVDKVQAAYTSQTCAECGY